MPHADCLSEAELRHYLLGELGGEELEHAAAHLEHCPRCNEAATRLEALTDSLVDGLRAHPPSPAQTTVSQAAPNASKHESPGRAPGFDTLEEVGRGGMGVVYRASEAALGRYLAVKVLRQGYAGHSLHEARFLGEARLTASLQHPGIPPVHAVGRLEDGRPFFSMKFVEGYTLDSLLRRKRDFAHDLPRLLTIFEQVCQAVASAHSKGIVHRDLKPGNVMVGAFGEVLVMDWGLAKDLNSSAPDLQGAARVGGGGGQQTLEGTVMGTPAYMAPEQARGEAGPHAVRSDVFGLGAILCDVLTGQPPFSGPGVRDVLVQAAAGDLRTAEKALAGCGADAELCQLARDCLAAQPDARPASAGEVAARVAAWRAGVEQRLKRAELERSAALTRAAEERKRRRLTVLLAGSVLLLAVLGCAVGLGLRERASQERERQAREATTRAMALEKWKWLAAQGRLAEAGVALDQEASRPSSAPGEEDGQLQSARSWQRFLTRVDDITQQQEAVLAETAQASDLAAAYAAAFREVGLDLSKGETDPLAGFAEAAPARQVVVAALDDWARLEPKAGLRGRLVAALGRLDPDPERDRVRRQFLRPELKGLVAALEGIDVKRLTPTLARGLARLSESLPPEPADLHTRAEGLSLALLRRAAARYPQDPWVNAEAAWRLYRRADADPWWRGTAGGAEPFRFPADADDASPAAEARRERLAAEAAGYYQVAAAFRPGRARLLESLGHARYRARDYEGAVEAYRRAVELDTTRAAAQCGLGLALCQLDRPAEAAGPFRRAQASHNTSLLVRVGQELLAQGRWGMAEEFLGKAIAAAGKRAGQVRLTACCDVLREAEKRALGGPGPDSKVPLSLLRQARLWAGAEVDALRKAAAEKSGKDDSGKSEVSGGPLPPILSLQLQQTLPAEEQRAWVKLREEIGRLPPRSRDQFPPPLWVRLD